MRTELELKCELQLVLGLLLGMCWSAIGLFFSLSLGRGGGVTLVLGLPQQEGYPSTRTFFLFFMQCGYKADRVTLELGNPSTQVGLSYLPCKRSPSDNSPTWDNFPLSCMTINLDNLSGVIQFLS